MLDQLTKSFSLAALIGLYLAAQFNIGFFYALGYHFIGVIDVSNIVYTFGLVIVFVFIGIALISLASLVATGAVDLWIELPDYIKALFVFCAVGAVFVISALLYRIEDEETSQFAIAFLILVVGILTAAIARVIWILRRRIEYFLLWSSFLFVTFGVFASGVALATHPLDQQTYDVLTKSGNILGVRIARSSSSGLILVKNKKVTFIPTGEVRSVSTTMLEGPKKNCPVDRAKSEN